mgnify:CR=1 FL=1
MAWIQIRLNSTNEINKVIQNELLGNVQQSIEGFETTFKLGAKVMQTVNDYDKKNTNSSSRSYAWICYFR